MAGDVNITDRIMQIARSRPGGQATDVEAVDYDWAVPHSLDADDVARVGAIAAAAAEEISRTLTRAFRDEQKLRPAELSELYGRDLRQGDEGNERYCLGLNLESGPAAGMVFIRAQVAANWVGKLLGGAAAQGDHGMSQLEVSVLSDIVGQVAEAFCRSLASAGGAAVTAADGMTDSAGQFIGADSDEYCCLAFHPDESDDEVMLTVALTSATVKAAPGQDEGETMDGQQQQAAMLEHIGATSLRAEVRVGLAQASVHDMAGLEVGDVLVLARGRDEPVELLIRDVVLARGHLATCDGHYALQVTQAAATMGRSELQKETQ